MITKKQVEILRENWIKASICLGFKLITPYYIEINETTKEIFAFMPEYGSPNGVIICLTSAPEFETDAQVTQWANENNIFHSFINFDLCLDYDEEYFNEVLNDWLKYE